MHIMEFYNTFCPSGVLQTLLQLHSLFENLLPRYDTLICLCKVKYSSNTTYLLAFLNGHNLKERARATTAVPLRQHLGQRQFPLHICGVLLEFYILQPGSIRWWKEPVKSIWMEKPGRGLGAHDLRIMPVMGEAIPHYKATVFPVARPRLAP